MNTRSAALLFLFVVVGASNFARADILPPNLCTMPGQPCRNACADGTSSCGRDSGIAGICKSTTCTRYGRLDAGPDADAGYGPIPYPCNLCFLETLDGGDGGADDAGVVDADDTDAGAGGAGGVGGMGGAGGTGGSAGGGASGADSGCSCFIDTDRLHTGRAVSLTLALASAGLFSWVRRRSARAAKKDNRAR